MYDSQISFTLDTICPWTYLAKKRLDEALTQLGPEVTSRVTFTLRVLPHQLYPAFGPPRDRHTWQRDTKFDGSEEAMARYAQVLTEYGAAVGIQFRFGGGGGAVIADTLEAHRVIQWFQENVKETERTGTISRLVDSLYRRYFEEEEGADPSSVETLVAACVEAGIEEGEARRVVEDHSEGLAEVKAALRETVVNGIDSVPTIVFEGRRRDLTLVGAKEVGEYVKAMQTIAKEST